MAGVGIEPDVWSGGALAAGGGGQVGSGEEVAGGAWNEAVLYIKLFLLVS